MFVIKILKDSIINNYNVERIDINDFYKGILTKPIIISGLANHWQAYKKWTLGYFREKYGDQKVNVYNKRMNEIYEVTLKDYLDYVLYTSNEDEDILYLRDWNYEEGAPELSDDYVIPDIFDNLLPYLSLREFPRLEWIYIGPKGSGTPLHQDIWMTHSWNALILGEKKWVFIPPEQSDLVYNGMVDAFNPDYNKYPLFEKTTKYYCVQKPGDIMYIPSGWWHQVDNSEHTIAITGNFVDYKNLKEFVGSYVASKKANA